MTRAPAAWPAARAGICEVCGIPMDAEHFDASPDPVDVGSVSLRPGDELVLAGFTLPSRYCGVLEYFSQFTDRLAAKKDHLTTGWIWALRMNGRPLHPYQQIRWIVNPWGFGSFPVNIRLDENATVELVVRSTGDTSPVQRIGGRITGRYWYNEIHGSRGTREV